MILLDGDGLRDAGRVVERRRTAQQRMVFNLCDFQNKTCFISDHGKQANADRLHFFSTPSSIPAHGGIAVDRPWKRKYLGAQKMFPAD